MFPLLCTKKAIIISFFKSLDCTISRRNQSFHRAQTLLFSTQSTIFSSPQIGVCFFFLSSNNAQRHAIRDPFFSPSGLQQITCMEFWAFYPQFLLVIFYNAVCFVCRTEPSLFGSCDRSLSLSVNSAVGRPTVYIIWYIICDPLTAIASFWCLYRIFEFFSCV